MTFSAASSLQTEIRSLLQTSRTVIAVSGVRTQDSGLRTQGSGEGSSVLLHTPNYHSTRANFNSHTNRTGTSRTCSLLLRFQAESDVWKEPLSLLSLSLLSLSLLSFCTERSTQVQSPRPKPVGLATATLSQPIFKPMAVVETCMFRRYSPRSSRPSLNGSCLLHRFLVNLLLERFELAQLG